jgi:hypothetical protein
LFTVFIGEAREESTGTEIGVVLSVPPIQAKHWIEKKTEKGFWFTSNRDVRYFHSMNYIGSSKVSLIYYWKFFLQPCIKNYSVLVKEKNEGRHACGGKIGLVLSVPMG